MGGQQGFGSGWTEGIQEGTYRDGPGGMELQWRFPAAGTPYMWKAEVRPECGALHSSTSAQAAHSPGGPLLTTAGSLTEGPTFRPDHGLLSP